MIEEIRDEQDAAKRLKAFFGDLKYHDAYAQMLGLLVDEKRFTAGLEKVSALIWEAYNSDPIRDSPNRYTRSNLAVANQNFGFACQENVVLTAAAGAKAFGERIRNGVLWKDSFALGHGEFAHSYQWLVAGKALGWGVKTAEIYRSTAGNASVLPLFVKDNFGIALRTTQLWEYVVDSTRYDPAFDSQATLAAKTWVETQLEKWSKKEVVNRSFVNLYFRSGELAGSCNLGQKYDAIAQERSEKDFVRNLSVAKKSGKPSKFIDSLAATFPFRNALTNSFRNANNVTDLARQVRNPPWFITVYEDHRYARLYERSNAKIRELASQLLGAAKLEKENSPLKGDQTWQKIEALLYEIGFDLWDTKSATFYKDLREKVTSEAKNLELPTKTPKDWFQGQLKGIPALKRERQEHYSDLTKKNEGWNPAQDDAGIYVRKVLQNEIVQKGIIPAKFHGRAGTISRNAFPGQLVL